jgi:hypothetical protein
LGEKIRVINNFNFDKGELEIELNKASTTDGPRYIHIQNEKFRFGITESEYIQLALTICKAAKFFRYNKDMKGDN